jgi:NAD(P)-dependent dehydrogenase (short-subunit alcohol dehydrogenase family)
LVTGAGLGIGRACAERFLDEGWRVIGWDLEPSDDERVSWLRVDVSDWDAVSEAAAGTGALDAVVNCAAIARITPTLEMSRDDWDRTIAINLSGAYYVSRHLFPALDARDGVLVHLSSVNATNTTTNRAPYNCSKAGVIALTQVLAVEWALAGSKVRVLAVSPGVTRTQQPLSRVEAGLVDEAVLLSRSPLRRWIEPAEIAAAIFRLVGEDFSALHGGNIFVDAGYNAWGGRI